MLIRSGQWLLDKQIKESFPLDVKLPSRKTSGRGEN